MYSVTLTWDLVSLQALTIARELDILIDRVPASQDDHIPTDKEFKDVITSEETVDVELYHHWFTSFLIAYQNEDPEIIQEAMRSTALVHAMAKKKYENSNLSIYLLTPIVPVLGNIQISGTTMHSWPIGMLNKYIVA